MAESVDAGVLGLAQGIANGSQIRWSVTREALDSKGVASSCLLPLLDGKYGEHEGLVGDEAAVSVHEVLGPIREGEMRLAIEAGGRHRVKLSRNGSIDGVTKAVGQKERRKGLGEKEWRGTPVEKVGHVVLHDSRCGGRRSGRGRSGGGSARGGSIRKLSGVGEAGEANFGITSCRMGLGIAGGDDAGMIGFDLDNDALEGNVYPDGVVVQVLQLHKRASSCAGHYGVDAPGAGHAVSVRKHHDLGTHLTGISSNA